MCDVVLHAALLSQGFRHGYSQIMTNLSNVEGLVALFGKAFCLRPWVEDRGIVFDHRSKIGACDVQDFCGDFISQGTKKIVTLASRKVV